MLIVQPLDGIFDNAGTSIESPDSKQTIAPDEAPPPSSPMLAGQARQKSRDHPYPPPSKADWFCSGFFVFSPSQAIVNYYMPIVNLEGRFDMLYPDQTLLNHAHRWDRPMPWAKFNYTLTTTYPTTKEYNMDAASLHEKYWLEQYRAGKYGQNILREMWLKAKVDMIEFYGKKDAE